MEDVKNCLSNAEIAVANKQYMEALAWYRKVLAITPEDIYALSRAGALCVPLGRFEEAMRYFGKARELDPENGDNAFNYGNACFFNKDNVKAFEMYVEAERVGCSDDVKPRLYYQMALLCSIRQDIKSSLVYFRKCEECDKSGLISLNPDLISEKLKLYMALQDYSNAETCAAQLIAINPTDFKGYMVYFSILMAHKNYDIAEKTLCDAEKYAELSNENRFALTMQIAALHTTKGDNERAIKILEDYSKAKNLTGDQLSQLMIALAEAHSKDGNYDIAIKILRGMITTPEVVYIAPESSGEEPDFCEMTPLEREEMMQNEENVIAELIACGEINPNMGPFTEPYYDEEGQVFHYYDVLEGLFADQTPKEDADAVELSAVDSYKLPVELREKVVFTLLTCHLAKDEFVAAQELANVLKLSENKYYNYFGLYTSAMTERKLTGDSDVANRKYAEAIAFFRNKALMDATDALACIFRARLYAEQGKYEKAAEIAFLLSDADQKALIEYIESCKA